MHSRAQQLSVINRTVGLTECDDGYNSLAPVTVDATASWWEVYADIEAQSFHLYPPRGENCRAWSPGYRAVDNEGVECDLADLMVFDLHGCSTDHVRSWLIENNLEGAVHPTRSDSMTSPRCRLILLLNRPTVDATYRRLWTRLAHEVFADLPDPAHVDLRQRYDQPYTNRRESLLQRVEGWPLDIDAALALSSFAGNAIGRASVAVYGEWVLSKAKAEDDGGDVFEYVTPIGSGNR